MRWKKRCRSLFNFDLDQALRAYGVKRCSATRAYIYYWKTVASCDPLGGCRSYVACRAALHVAPQACCSCQPIPSRLRFKTKHRQSRASKDAIVFYRSPSSLDRRPLQLGRQQKCRACSADPNGAVKHGCKISVGIAPQAHEAPRLGPLYLSQQPN